MRLLFLLLLVLLLVTVASTGLWEEPFIGAGPCLDDQWAENDTFAEATPLSLPSIHAGRQLCQDEDDYFSFRLAAGETLRADLAFLHAAGDLDLVLYNAGLVPVAESDTTTNDESIVFTPLSSGTYYLRVTGFSGAENSYTIRVASVGRYPPNQVLYLPVVIDQAVDVRLAVIGDFGRPGPAEEDVANLVASWNVDFIATVGDNRYDQYSMDEAVGQYYCHYLTDVTNGTYCAGGNSAVNAFFPALGNHDYTDGNGLSAYLAYFNLPGDNVETLGTSGTERYYDVSQDGVHLFFLDSEGAKDNGDRADQMDWLQTALADSTARWKFVLMHHAPYSSARHGSQDYMQWPYAAWGASAVIAGHDHVYERLHVDGLPYFVNGLGGTPNIYPFDPPLTSSQVRYNKDHGAILIVASENQVILRFITRDGAVIDQYVISS